MKFLLLPFTWLFAVSIHAQSKEETNILALSQKVFAWEVDNKIDSLDKIFDAKFVVIGSNGNAQTKPQYIARLRSGDFIHNSIVVEETAARVVNNTAIVTGKGIFSVTSAGNKLSLHLAYTEVFTRADANSPWTILGMHANALDH